MKRTTAILIWLVALCVWSPWVFAAWDKDKPASSTSLRASNPEILSNFAALETAIGQDHEFSTGGTNSGKHTVITIEEKASAGASATNELHVQAIDGGSQPELAVTSEDGNELQMTKDGDLFSSAGLVVTGTSTFNSSITLGDGDDLIGSATSDITMNTDKFTVAGDTGNTVVAGTLDVTGVLTTTAASVLGDGSTLAAATEVGDGDRVISDKAYVDNHTGGAAATEQDSESNDMIEGHSYQAQTSGYVTAYEPAGTAAAIAGWISPNADPTTGVGVRVSLADGVAGSVIPLMFFVPNQFFFEIQTSATPDIFWTPLVVGGGAPIDQD